MRNHADNLADAAVAYLADAHNWESPPTLTFQTQKSYDPGPLVERENLPTTVIVTPVGWSAEKIGRGGTVMGTYEFSVLVAGGIDGSLTEDKYLDLSADIDQGLRRAETLTRNNYQYMYSTIETTLYDPTILRQHRAIAVQLRYGYLLARR